MKNIHLALLLVSAMIAFNSCNKKKEESPSPKLSPARNLEGIWTTPFPVNFYYLTDKCGGFVRYADQAQKITWTINSTSDTEVSIFNSTDYKGPITIYSVCSEQPIPVSYVVNSSMKGVISSSQMDLYVNSELVGSMSFTSNNLAGNYNRKICDTYGCTGLNTNDKELILTKQ